MQVAASYGTESRSSFSLELRENAARVCVTAFIVATCYGERSFLPQIVRWRTRRDRQLGPAESHSTGTPVSHGKPRYIREIRSRCFIVRRM